VSRHKQLHDGHLPSVVLVAQQTIVCHALSETKTIIQQVVFFKKKQEKIYSLLTLQIKIIRYNILKEKYSKT
jgi:hypothetical protein